VGRWVYTDEHGWLWASDEPWGWAVYHYGRWTFDNEYGWTWVPGAVWGPAWVAWRGGAGFVGWAPLPPAVGFAAGVGPNFAHFDVSVGIPPPAWVFVPETAILAPRIREEIVLPARNVTIIKTTQNVTNITVVNNRIVNVGLPPQRIEQATGRPVPRRRVQEIGSAGELAGSPEGEDTVRVFRPPVAKAKRRGPAPAKKSDRDEPGPEPAAEEEELFRRHEAEHRALDANDAQATETLEEQHRREKANPPPGVGPEELQKRHKEELRAKHEQEERERQIQERRHAREEGKHKDRDSGPPERGAGKDAPTSKPAKKKKKE
jgi:hypothetical protein